ncbi:unnamed protein product [Gongylonema pulchrum]|uniref:Uncharacterized protein n=1 Tax=Gongylonema pulchrum TaxID=637853 RepID=A0A183DDE1_9BILA|nr:unnamed protein product [Gongylonema pulchrum]
MPPQKSLIAELLEKQAKIEQEARKPAVAPPRPRNSAYCDVDLQISVGILFLSTALGKSSQAVRDARFVVERSQFEVGRAKILRRN